MHETQFSYKLATLFACTLMILVVSPLETFGEHGVPTKAKAWPEVSSDGTSAYVDGKTVWLKLDADTVKGKKTSMPRLCAPIRSIQWKGHPDANLKIRPAQQAWTFSWNEAPSDSSIIEVVFDSKPLLPRDCPIAIPAGDGSVMLHAWQAKTVGEKILFEPQWYKNTVGYWAIESDYATWELKIDQPGTYSIAMLQGCGAGHGGSEAVVTLRKKDQVKADLPFRTIDTGHFQNFRWNHLGMIQLTETGEYQLRIDATKIAKVALFDVRTIHLVRQATETQQ